MSEPEVRLNVTDAKGGSQERIRKRHQKVLQEAGVKAALERVACEDREDSRRQIVPDQTCRGSHHLTALVALVAAPHPTPALTTVPPEWQSSLLPWLVGPGDLNHRAPGTQRSSAPRPHPRTLCLHRPSLMDQKRNLPVSLWSKLPQNCTEVIKR